MPTEPDQPLRRSGGMKTPPATSAFHIVAVVALLVAVIGCAPAEGSPDAVTPGSLAGGSWAVVSVDGRSAVPGREPTVAFTASRVEGSTGCNSYGGDYTYDVDTGTLTFGPVASTLILCEGPVGAFEGAFGQALQAPLRVSVEGARMTLQGVAHVTVLFDIGDNTGG